MNILHIGADILKLTLELKDVFPTPISIDNQRAARYVKTTMYLLCNIMLSSICMFYRALQVAAIHGGYPESAIAVINVHNKFILYIILYISFCAYNMICNVVHEERSSSCRSVLVGCRLGNLEIENK